ncbi:DNA-binding ferritin-like protein [Haloferula luteola]|uniref:DNA-binding ferritin-like protein n=1 Tax=Haloferula luteola TaxID=595692 RepID=A0A840VF05_9BACT|nr:hypothetical protein [Haloferula luteola]MBB5352409.1 DNA-binding ferritin-like protein [Haloferula luteola]
MLEPKPTRSPLPESLRVQLEEYRRQLWRTKIAEAVFAGIFGLLLSFLIVFAIDRFSATPPMGRLIILLAGTSLSAIFAPIWLHRWVWRHRDHDQLARLIAKKHSGLGDRLLGVIDLANQIESDDSLSPRLRAAAMEAVAAETQRRKLDDLLPLSRHKRWSLAVILLFLIAGIALIAVPEAGLNSLKRWLFPLSETPRYTFTQLEALPSELAVPVGEAFSLELHLASGSRWQPPTARARFASQDPLETSLHGQRYHFEFPGQLQPGFLRLEVGDAIHKIFVTPSLRPSLIRSQAVIEFPTYLRREQESQVLTTGTVRAVEGANVQLSVEADRALVRASAGPISALQAGSGEAPELTPSQPMTLDGAKATAPSIEVGATSLKIPLQWTDTLGLDGAPGFELRIEAVPDEAPIVYIEGLSGNRAMLPSETIDFTVSAADDFGLQSIGLEWQGEPTRPGDAESASGELTLQQGSPDLTRAGLPVAFSPDTLGIAPQKLTLRAWSTDYLPGRTRTYSQPLTLYILTPAEHAQMLKNRLDRTVGELEDLARKERSLYEENQRIERLDATELRTPENLLRLQSQQQLEDRQAEALKELGDRVEELLKDSARNDTIDPETLRRMSEMMESLRELGNQDLPGVSGKLGEAGDAKNSDEKSERDMSDAVERQKEALEKIRKTIEEANEANQRFEASTFVSRLKKAAGDQEGITRTSLAGFERFGLRPDELDPAELGERDDLVRLQSATGSEIRWIQEDLGHFFTRTANPDYGKVFEAMQDSGIQIELENIRQQIERNQGYLAASSSHQWSDQLREWAKMLEGASNEAGGGGGGGGGGGSDEDEDFEFMLRVMRMVQEEQDLRARTRALETLRRAKEENP